MRAHDDPVSEIRRALDREVARSFDATRLARAVDSRLRSRQAPRVPASMQWIGIAAALVAAATGLRSLYLDWNAPHPTPERAAVEAPLVPVEVEPDVEPQVPPAAVPAPRREPVRERRPVIAERRPRPAPAPEIPRRVSESASAEAPKATPRAAAPVVVATAPQRRPPAPAVAAPLVVTAEAPAPAPVRAGVEVRSILLYGQSLVPRVEEVPEVGATLIRVLPRQVRIRPDKDRGRGERSSEEPRTEKSPDEPATDYYVRVFHGSAFRRVSDAHGIATANARVVPLPEIEVWGSEAHASYLRRAFLLSSVLVFDGVRLAEPSKGAQGEGSLLVATAEKVHEVSVLAAPEAAAERRHRIVVSLSESGSSRVVEADLSLAEEKVAILAVPDLLLRDEPERGPRPSHDTTFVAVSARRADRALSGGGEERFLERPDDLPILIEGEGEARRDRGTPDEERVEVKLRAVVRADGSVGAVEVIELPEAEGAERWIAELSGRVREWRYLPARHEGVPVATYVTIAIEAPER